MSILQIRGVDDDDLETLRERARQSGVSLSTYIRSVLHTVATNPTRRDVMDSIAASPPVEVTNEEIVDLISAARPA